MTKKFNQYLGKARKEYKRLPLEKMKKEYEISKTKK